MADLGIDIDPNTIEPSKFDDMPIGEHIAAIVESTVEKTKAGTGQKLSLTWQVTQGECEGRKFWQNVNYQNDSRAAQEIGQRQLKEICTAVGYTDHIPRETEVLHNVECRVTLGMDKGGNGYAPKPEVKKVKPVNLAVPEAKRGATAAPAAAKPAPAPAPAPAAGRGPGGAAKPAGPAGARPWQNKSGTQAA